MSTTNVYALFETKVNCIAELSNGYGSGMAIWNYISLKLYNEKFNTFSHDSFWSSYKSPRLDNDEKAVLLSTYDYAFIEIDHLAEFANACIKIHELIISTTEWEWSHFEAIGNLAHELDKKHDHRCKGLAIGCTSVCDPWEQDDIKNIKSWGVYEEIKDLKDAVETV